MLKDESPRNAVEILGEDFVCRYRRGQSPQIDAYAEEHPELAEEIHELFPAMLAMERLKQRELPPPSRPIDLGVDRLEELGDYRIVDEIGRGGMGIVYEAEQQSIGRRVAVKVFPQQAIGDSTHLKRFKREAQTAGQLHHTNIVPVFGVGEQDGLHYFVMQRLHGLPLDRIIAGLNDCAAAADGPVADPFGEVFRMLRPTRGSKDPTRPANAADPGQAASAANRLLAKPTAELPPAGASKVPSDKHTARAKTPRFTAKYWQNLAVIGEQVASALKYAHAQGVMHRDVKPANLILDANLQVWVTDFGLAVGPAHDRLSQSGDVVGTLRYMAPEHLHGRSDHRCDIYSLGLTLYELATLRPAFQGDNRGSLIRQVSTSRPPAPRTLCPAIPRDLETIILRAIAPDPDDRYQSAAELGEDLERFTKDLPIRARRMNPVERTVRWIRKNPLAAAIACLFVVGCLSSFVAISWQWQQAVAEKRKAQNANARAEINLTLALESMEQFLGRFESDWMAHPVAPEADADSENADMQQRFIVSDRSARVLEDALAFYDQFAKQNQSNPQLQRDTAIAYRRAGEIHQRLGQYQQAANAYQQSASLMRQQMADRHTDPHFMVELAATHNQLGLALYEVYRNEEAKAQFDIARRTLGKPLLHREDFAPAIYQLALTNSNLGNVLWRMRERDQSAQRHRRAIMLLEQLVAESGETAEYRLALARAYGNYYPFAAFGSERSYAAEIRSLAATLLEQLVADFPNVPDYSCELAEMLTRAADWGRRQDHEQRLGHVEKAITLTRELTGKYEPIPRYQAALAGALAVRGSLHRKSEHAAQNAAAEQDYAEAIELYRDLCRRFPDVASYRAFVARALLGRGSTLREQGDFEAARSDLEQAVEQQKGYIEAHPETIFGRKTLAKCYRELSRTLEELGLPEESQRYREHASREGGADRRD